MRSSVLILDETNNARLYEPLKRIIKFNIKKKYSYFRVCNDEEIDIMLLKQKISLVFEGEEFYIRKLRLPRVRKYLMDNLVVNELTYIFKEINNFNFTYEILRKTKTEVEVLVFCINSEKNTIFNTLSDKCNVAGIYLIQLCLFQVIKNSLIKSKSIIVFQHNNYTYIMACSNGNIIANSVIKRLNGKTNELIQKVQYVMNRAIELEKEFEAIEEQYEIITVNFENKDLIQELNEFHSCQDFGSLDILEVISVLR